MNFLFAGGGSGGHLFPGIAVAEELNRFESNLNLLFVGSDRPVEKQILADYRCNHFPLALSSSSTMLRKPFSSILKNWQGYRTSLSLLKQYRPEVVIGLGGFASLPTVVAAWRRKIPVLLLEQNAVLGRANRFLLPFANQICLSYPSTPIPKRQSSKAVLTGNPVRSEIIATAPHSRSTPRTSRNLLVLGGSQGASAVNQAVLTAFPKLQSQLIGWNVVHQTGERDRVWVQEEYHRLGIRAQVYSFIEDMDRKYQLADVVISRAGGTTLAELAIHHIPAVLIPYPNSVRDHQTHNALGYIQSGGGVLVKQSAQLGQTVDDLVDSLTSLLTNSVQREAMREACADFALPNAAQSIAKIVWQYCRPSSPATNSNSVTDAA